MFISKPMSVRSSIYPIVRSNAGVSMNSFAPSCHPFPGGSFPGLLGKIAGDLSDCGGVAPEIIGTVLIGFASLLTQGIADVTWPNGQVTSIGANGLVDSPSASGKSLIFDLLNEPIKKCLDDNQGGEGYDLLLEDATREAIVIALHEQPVAGLFSDEAGMLKRLLRDSPTLVKLLNGSTLRSARISTGRLTLLRPRFCMLLMEQPLKFEETKALLGAGKGGVGLINRFFVMQSKEFLAENSPHHVQLSADVKQEFFIRSSSLLDALFRHIELGNPVRPALKLSADAAQCLIDIDQEARRKCKPDSPWFFVSEYVLRHAERVLRLAGVFHVFEYGTDGEISLDTLQRAESFGDWYVDSFAQIFYEPPQITQEEVDADKLEQLFIQTSWAGTSMFRQSDMRTLALNVGLTPTRFTRALACLCKQGRAWMMSHQNKPWIAINLSRLPQYR